MPHGFIPVANVASVEMIYVISGQIAENVFYVQKGSPYTLAQLQALRGTVDSWDSATWKALRTGGASLIRIRSRARDSSSAPAEDYFLPTARPGTRSGTILLPNNVTLAIKLVTGLAGRSFRGRLYFIGMNDTCLSGNSNVADTTWANAVVAALNTLQTNLASAGHTLGVVSYRTGGVYRSNGLFTASTGWVLADYNLDSQRRRLTGRGI